jgi:hypothetical protein
MLAAAGEHGLVEARRRRHYGPCVARPIGRFDITQGLLHGRKLLRIARQGRCLGGGGFEQGPDLIDLGGLRGIEAGHHRAVVRHRLHQALGLEMTDHFPDHGPRYAKLSTEIALGQTLARLEAKIDDGGADAFQCHFSQGAWHLAYPHVLRFGFGRGGHA